MSNSLEYFKEKLNTAVLDQVLSPCYNLSVILGDTGGFITKGMSESVLLDYELLPSGTLITTRLDLSGYSLDFINSVSVKASDTYAKLKAKDPSLVYSILGDTLTLKTASPLINYSRTLSDINRYRCNAIYVEVLGVYLELMMCSLSSVFRGILKSDMDRMDNNIRVVTRDLELYGMQEIELVHILRDLQRTLSFIRRIDFLFTLRYSTRINNFTMGV